MKLSIVIPAYNEENRIGKTLKNYLSYFTKKYKNSYELIVVMNGCRDNTAGVVYSFKKHKQLRVLDFKEGIGKGGAVIEGFKVAKGDAIGFVDADESTKAEEYDRIFTKMGDVDCIIASRYMKGAKMEPKQGPVRILASRGFNLLIKQLFGLKIKDSQCGAKIFTKHAVKTILPKLGLTKWAFDVDLLYQLKREGFILKEIPTIWQDDADSNLNVRRATVEMFLSIARLRLVYSPFKPIVTVYDKTIGRRKWGLLPLNK